MLLVSGLSGAFAGRDPVLRRIEARGRLRGKAADTGLLRPKADEPRGLMKTLIPADDKQRSDIERQLAQAGFPGAGAVRTFHLIRLGLGLVLPALAVGAIRVICTGTLPAPDDVVAMI